MGDPWEKPPDHPQAELGLSRMWPELGSNPKRWDDERFRVLKISALWGRQYFFSPHVLIFSLIWAMWFYHKSNAAKGWNGKQSRPFQQVSNILQTAGQTFNIVKSCVCVFKIIH